MKCYKLIKDLPTFKAGEEFYINNKGHLISEKRSPLVAYTCGTLKKYPHILNDWFEEIEENEEYKRWRAKVGGVYYHYEEGRTYRDIETWDVVNGMCYVTGNYFKTEKEAEKYGEYLIALQIIKDDAKGFKPDWDVRYQSKYCGRYNYMTRDIEYHHEFVFKIQGTIYFKSKEDIEESFEKHRKEWLIVLEVENEDR